MKKLIFTTLMAGLSGVVLAQGQALEEKNTVIKGSHPIRFNTSPFEKNNGTYNKSEVHAWYSYPQMLSEAQIVTITSGALVFLNGDSLAKSVDVGDTVSYDGTYLCTGTILDPKDDVIDQTNSFVGQKFSAITSGTVDSILFGYIYNRFQDEVLDVPSGNMVPVVDTLFVTYVNGQNLTYSGGTASSPQRYAFADFDQAKRFPARYALIDTILLTADVETEPETPEHSWVPKTMVLGVSTPLPINTNRSSNIKNTNVGVFLSFKSGIKYDTSYYYQYRGTGTAPANNKRLNYFGTRFYADDNTTKYGNPNFYNTTCLTSVRNGYPQTKYLAMQPISLNGFYLDLDLFISSLNVGLKQVSNDVFASSNIFPNPVIIGDNATMSFNLKNTANVNIAIYNIAGQLVKSFVNKNFIAGENNIELDLAGLKAGIYMVKMTANGSSITKKLSITQ